MQRINKRTSAPLTMAFIVLSVALMPFSMKAVGVNINLSPRLGAVVEAWTHVAGVFVVGYQPFNTSAWPSLDLGGVELPETKDESDEHCSLIAQLYSTGSGEDCGLTSEPSEVSSSPQLEARAFSPALKQRATARRAEADAPLRVEAALPVKANYDDVVIDVQMDLPAVAMKHLKALSPRAFKRLERTGVRVELAKSMQVAVRELAAPRSPGVTFAFRGGDKSEAIGCDVDDAIEAARSPEPAERLRRVRLIDAAQDTFNFEPEV